VGRARSPDSKSGRGVRSRSSRIAGTRPPGRTPTSRSSSTLGYASWRRALERADKFDNNLGLRGDIDGARSAEGLSFGECPRWHHGRLWYSTSIAGGVYSVDVPCEERLEHVVEKQPRDSGGYPMAICSVCPCWTTGCFVFTDGEPSLFCDISPYCGFWANDLITSAAGVS